MENQAAIMFPQKKQLLPLRKSSKSYKLTVTKALQEKIKLIGKRWPHNEWSGTLFYKVEGNFEDDTLHLIAVDVYPQDKGISVFTEFNNDPSLAFYMVENDLIDCYQGLVHCHPTFASNASGTDWNTINDEGTDRTHFLSLIVSNTHPYHAYLTRRIVDKLHKDVTSNKEYISWEDRKIVLSTESHEEEAKEEYIESFELEIEVEEVELIKTPLEIRLDELETSNNSYANKGKGTYINSKPSEVKTLFKGFTPKSNNSKELSLFPEQTDSKVEVEEYVSDDIINKHAAILITGDILAPKKVKNPNNPDYLKRYADNMTELFAHAFETEESFTYWADAIIDYLHEDLIINMDIQKMPSDKDDDTSEIILEWSDKLIDALATLANNSYITYYTHALMNYA